MYTYHFWYLVGNNLISLVVGSSLSLSFFLLFILSKEKRPRVVPSAQAEGKIYDDYYKYA
jgi:hypothetical protein